MDYKRCEYIAKLNDGRIFCVVNHVKYHRLINPIENPNCKECKDFKDIDLIL